MHQVAYFQPERLSNAFAELRRDGVPGFIPYIMAGFPTLDATVPILLSMQKGGASVIELGVPFSDPIADGPVIQLSAVKALENGVTLPWIFKTVKEARQAGLTVPILLMGYYNPILQFGLSRAVKEAKDAGVDAYLVVDLSENSLDNEFIGLCKKERIKFVHMISPTTEEKRLKYALDAAVEDGGFVYLVSLLGVTGSSTFNEKDVQKLVGRIRKINDEANLAVGFGISTREHVSAVGKFADAVIVGTQIIRVVEQEKTVDNMCQKLESYITAVGKGHKRQPQGSLIADEERDHLNGNGHPPAPSSGTFGSFGGQYVPEVLSACLSELSSGWSTAEKDPSFWKKLNTHLKEFVGRPTPLHLAERLTTKYRGAKIWFKREDLNHTGAHKINNAIGQCLLARRLGKRRIIAETGAGQHGVATATVCAKFGLECVVYMGAEDCRRQALNVFRMKLLGAKVVPVKSGSSTLKDAVNEAMREWVRTVQDTHYIIGSAIGPHPFPTIVRDLQAVIGKEARTQCLEKGFSPDKVVACIGGGSNSIGMFHAFRGDKGVALVGVEAAGQGVESDHHSASVSLGTPGVLHGTKTLLLQDDQGQIMETSSISAGLDYPAVGPEHAHLHETGRCQYLVCTDHDALSAFIETSQMEGIIPALETAHALHVAYKLASEMKRDQNVVICMSGRGDKDVRTVQDYLDDHPELKL